MIKTDGWTKETMTEKITQLRAEVQTLKQEVSHWKHEAGQFKADVVRLVREKATLESKLALATEALGEIAAPAPGCIVPARKRREAAKKALRDLDQPVLDTPKLSDTERFKIIGSLRCIDFRANGIIRWIKDPNMHPEAEAVAIAGHAKDALLALGCQVGALAVTEKEQNHAPSVQRIDADDVCPCGEPWSKHVPGSACGNPPNYKPATKSEGSTTAGTQQGRVEFGYDAQVFCVNHQSFNCGCGASTSKESKR